MWQTLGRWLRYLHEDEGGSFWSWLIPLALSVIQWNRQEQARREIEQAEEAQVPVEQANIRQTLIERGLGGTSATKALIHEPRRQYEVAKRVRKARDILGTQTVDPLTVALQHYASLQRQQGGAPYQYPDPTYSILGPQYYPPRGYGGGGYGRY